jgi:hypothetical protein
MTDSVTDFENLGRTFSGVHEKRFNPGGTPKSSKGKAIQDNPFQPQTEATTSVQTDHK